MKVVLVTSYFKSKGGVARVVDNFAKYLVSKNDQVIIASLYADKNLFVRQKGISIVDLADENTLPQSINFWLSLNKLQKKFSKLVHDEKPDVILFNDFPSTLWAQKFSGIPILCYTHDIHLLYTETYINNLPRITRILWRFFRIFIRIYDRKKWNCFDQIICNSNFMSSYIKKTYLKNAKVIYPGINTTIFSPTKNQTKQKSILTMGDLKVRRADFLINTAGKLSKKRKDFKIWVVGAKKEEEEILKKLVKQHNLVGMVDFFGIINNDVELAKIYSESTVLVHTVKESAFGYIVGESMSCQTPVISWKPSGLEELIEDGISGFNIEENNSEVLIKHIEKFLDDPKLSFEMGKNARLRVKNFIEKDEKFDELRELLKFWVKEKNN